MAIHTAQSVKHFLYIACTFWTLGFCICYWYITFINNQSKILHQGTGNWYWECNSTSFTCQRRLWSDGFGQSLRTCQMTCGPIPIWPQPLLVQFRESGQRHSTRFNSAKIEILPGDVPNDRVSELLYHAYRIFEEDINTAELNPISKIKALMYDYTLRISTSVIQNHDVQFNISMNETYRLTVDESEGIIYANILSETFFGARHALETLRQLIWYDEVEGTLKMITNVIILDWPEFPYRGLLLDTGNRYIPVSAIKRTINGMAATKMNVFHWHMTGFSSFPLVTQNIEHTIYGAFSSKETYSTNGIINVVNYANVRGIKVLIEIDNPGEIGQGWSWGSRKNIGNLSLHCYKNSCTELDQEDKYYDQMNVNNIHVYRYLRDIFQQIKSMTNQTDVVHLGGSVNFQCLMDSPEIKRMRQFKEKGIDGVLKYHQTMLYKMISDIYETTTPSIILWLDYFKQYEDLTKIIDNKIYIAQVNSKSTFNDSIDLIDKGYRVIISHPEWDLSRVTQWKQVYDHKPWEGVSLDKMKYILGGEALVWTNLLDEQSLDTMLWPNAAVIAEVLWSDSRMTLEKVSVNLQVFRERLLERGISAAPLLPKWCIQNPTACL